MNFMQTGRMLGDLGKHVWGGMGGTARSAAVGAGAGAVWGGVSSDTSVIGGAMMGAGLGAAGSRYGRSGFAGMTSRWNSAAGMFAGGAYGKGASVLASGAARPMASAIMRDVRGASLMANKGISSIRSSLKNWRSL